MAGSEDGMAKFLIGLLLGIALAFGYVRWGLSMPGIAQLPEKLRGNIISTAVEGELYDLDKPLEVRRRALEVFFQNRAKFAVEVDAEFSHPFLNALYLRRVIREARILRGYWDAFDRLFEQPALRAALEKQHGTTDEIALKQAMLFEKFSEELFLAQWVAEHEGEVTPEGLLPLLVKLSAQPG
jgi:hypothetical protein